MLIFIILLELLSVPISPSKLFVRGEIVDSAFRLIPAQTRSCWRGLAPPPPVEEHPMEEEEESDLEEAAPPFTPFGGVPLLTYQPVVQVT